MTDDLVRAALLDGKPALAAWARARQDPDCIDDAPYWILPQLYRNLSALGVDDPAMARLKGVYRHAWAGNQLELDRARALVENAGATPILVGGIPLCLLYYGDAGARPVGAAEIVRPHGAVRLPLPDDELRAHAVPLPLGGGCTALALEPALELVLVCARERPWWIADALAITRTGAVDWARFERHAPRWGGVDFGAALARVRAEDASAVPAGLAERMPRPRLLPRLRRRVRRALPRTGTRRSPSSGLPGRRRPPRPAA
jgi:hypothetical protein